MVVVLLGVVALGFLLGEPHLEGRNARATVFEVYFHDPFLAYVYIGSIPFFVALYQAFQVLGYFGRNRLFSPAAVQGLRTIRYCAMAMIGFVAVGEILILMHGDPEDRPAGVFMGLLIVCGSMAMAMAAATCERMVQNGLETHVD